MPTITEKPQYCSFDGYDAISLMGDILNILNKDCVNKATTAYTGIDWRKFHKEFHKDWAAMFGFIFIAVSIVWSVVALILFSVKVLNETDGIWILGILFASAAIIIVIVIWRLRTK